MSLAAFVRRTKTLHKNLAALVKKYPEDALPPDDKIFNRLLTNDWRLLHNDYGPLERRYLEAAKWVKELNSYDSELREFCVYDLGWAAKPTELPMNSKLPFPASQLLHILDIQLHVLRRWDRQAGAETSSDMRARIAVQVKKKGTKNVAADVELTTDTLRDFINGKTNPQRETLRAIERYLNSQNSRM